jgi:peroxiredoxin Q/BCP
MLKIGSKAPGFTTQDQNGKTVSLSDFLGETIALVFYPKDNTPTCTEQLCNLRDNYNLIKKNKITLLAISIDGEESHKKFENKFELPFILLTDEDKKIVNKYKIWAMKKLYGREYMGTLRTTFIINKKGKIEHIIEKVSAKTHTQQILDLVL